MRLADELLLDLETGELRGRCYGEGVEVLAEGVDALETGPGVEVVRMSADASGVVVETAFAEEVSVEDRAVRRTAVVGGK